MKSFFSSIQLLVLLLLCICSRLSAQENSVIMTIANDVQLSYTVYEFDLLLYDPDPSQPYQVSSVQAGIYINPALYNNGSITASIIPGASQFNAMQQPTSVIFTQSSSIIKIAPKTPPGCGSGTIISTDPNSRTRLTRIRLTCSIGFAYCIIPDLAFCYTTTPYPTKVAYYQASNCVSAQSPVNTSTCFSMATNMPYNWSLGAQMMNVTGGGSTCVGGPGLPVGLSSSENNMGYVLMKDGIGYTGILYGTGSPLSFGPQPPGTYTIEASSACNTLPTILMNGSAVITAAPGSIGGNVNGPASIIEGITTLNLTLTGYSGSILKWQKCLNSGTWTDIPVTTFTFSEIPSSSGSWQYRAVVQNGSCPSDNSSILTVTVQSRTLQVYLFLQGLYNSTTGLMEKARDENGNKYPGEIADMITVKLAHNAAPYAIEYTINNVALMRNGDLILDLPAGSVSSYYLVIKHRNSIETWSAVPVNLGAASPGWIFTNSSSSAYGSNLLNVGSAWVFYGGDENQDGIVDSGDMIDIDNDAASFMAGYLATDINGDGLIDSGDMILVDNNVGLFIGVVHP